MKPLVIIRVVIGASIIVIALIAVGVFLLAAPFPRTVPQIQGVSFSVSHAENLGLNWKQLYEDMLDDLQIRNLRLSAYWDTIEIADNTYDFSDLDFQMNEAARRGANVILAIGRKLPRWPECHVPSWAHELPEQDQQEKVLEFLPVVINRYKDHQALEMWQLENEPLLDFGECPLENESFLRAEETLVRSLDTTHPILVTDSGELNWWFDSSKYGDVLGTTMYRTVFSGKLQGPFRYDYIFPSWLYRLKSRYVKILRGKDVLISELQGEPWGRTSFQDLSKEEREDSFSIDRFQTNFAFAKRTQLPESYWWGVEYWYWEKEVQQDSRYWDFARTVFSQ